MRTPSASIGETENPKKRATPRPIAQAEPAIRPQLADFNSRRPN
jgi:hypothetical protein